jgi:hypothetical protein
LENANVDPKNVVKIIGEDWAFIAKQIAKARKDNRKNPSIKPMMSCWSVWCGFITGKISRAFGPYALGSIRKEDGIKYFVDHLANDGIEAVVSNLSARIRVLDLALAASRRELEADTPAAPRPNKSARDPLRERRRVHASDDEAVATHSDGRPT